MKVRFTTTSCGPDSGKNFNAGQVADVQPSLAREFIASRTAVPLEPMQPERATAKAKPEKRGKQDDDFNADA